MKWEAAKVLCFSTCSRYTSNIIYFPSYLFMWNVSCEKRTKFWWRIEKKKKTFEWKIYSHHGFHKTKITIFEWCYARSTTFMENVFYCALKRTLLIVKCSCYPNKGDWWTLNVYLYVRYLYDINLNVVNILFSLRVRFRFLRMLELHSEIRAKNAISFSMLNIWL